MPPFFLPVDAIVFWSLTLAALSVCVGAVCVRYRDEGLYSSAFVFCLGAFVYFFSVPLERFIRGQVEEVLHGEHFQVAAPGIIYFKIASMGIAGVIAFALSLQATGFKTHMADSRAPLTQTGGTRLFELALMAFWAGLVAIMLIFFYDFIRHVSLSYEASYSTQYNSPLPTLIMQIICLLNSILAVILAMRRKILPIIVAALLFLVNFYLAFLLKEKSPGVIALIGMGYLYFYWVRFKSVALLGALAGVILALFVLKPVYNILNEYAYTEKPQSVMTHLLNINSRFTFTNLDSSGPMLVSAHILKEDAAPSYGRDLLQSMSIFVPRFIWSDRPLDASEAFAKKMIPTWEPGIGLGYSPVIEGFVNFGFWFSWVEFVLFGLVWGYMWRGFMRLFRDYGAPAHLDVIYRIAGYYVLILFFRGMLAGVMKQTLMYMIPFAIALAGMQFLAWVWQRFHRRRMVA